MRGLGRHSYAANEVATVVFVSLALPSITVDLLLMDLTVMQLFAIAKFYLQFQKVETT